MSNGVRSNPVTSWYGFPDMRNRWPISVGIAVVGALAGVAIAGRPTVSDSFLTNAAASTSSGPSSSVANSSAAASTTSTAEPVATSESLLPTSTSVLPTSTSTSITPTTVAPPTTAPPPDTTTTVAPVAETLDRAQVRIVLANGDGRFNLVGANKSRLEAAGYISIDQEDVASATATILYYRPGFDDEAAIVAADLLVPQALLQPLPDTPVTGSDAAGDVIVVLGPDAVR